MPTLVTTWPETKAGELLVGGVPVSLLAERVGSTPFFAYDRALVTRRVDGLRRLLPDEMEIRYAVKANPMPALVQHLSGVVDGFDVASGAELRVVLDTPTPASQVAFAGPGKSEAELRQAVAAGVLVELESSVEGSRLVTAANDLGIRPRVAVRVNPDFAVKGSGMRMGGGPQQFGVDAERVPDLVADLEGGGVDVLGYHVFAGSQNLHGEIIAEAVDRAADLVVRLGKCLTGELRYANLGGGFGIPYYATESPLDMGPVSDALTRASERLRSHSPDLRVVVELGRFIVGEAGVYVTRVVDRKESRGSIFLVVDGGMHHQMAASGNFGQVIRRNYPVRVAGPRGGPGTAPETVQVVGCLCTPLDLLGDKVELPPAKIGDLVAVHQAGAYGLTASPVLFLSHPQPVEVLV